MVPTRAAHATGQAGQTTAVIVGRWIFVARPRGPEVPCLDDLREGDLRPRADATQVVLAGALKLLKHESACGTKAEVAYRTSMTSAAGARAAAARGSPGSSSCAASRRAG